jgi:hypothetical protein
VDHSKDEDEGVSTGESVESPPQSENQVAVVEEKPKPKPKRNDEPKPRQMLFQASTVEV